MISESGPGCCSSCESNMRENEVEGLGSRPGVGGGGISSESRYCIKGYAAKGNNPNLDNLRAPDLGQISTLTAN